MLMIGVPSIYIGRAVPLHNKQFYLDYARTLLYLLHHFRFSIFNFQSLHTKEQCHLIQYVIVNVISIPMRGEQLQQMDLGFSDLKFQSPRKENNQRLDRGLWIVIFSIPTHEGTIQVPCTNSSMYRFQSLHTRERCRGHESRNRRSGFNPYIRGNDRGISTFTHLCTISIPTYEGTIREDARSQGHRLFQSLHTRERLITGMNSSIFIVSIPTYEGTIASVDC